MATKASLAAANGIAQPGDSLMFNKLLLPKTMAFPKINGWLFLLVLMGAMASCEQRAATCDEYRSYFFKQQVAAIITDKGSEGRHFVIEGVDPITHQKVVYSDDDSMYIVIRENLAIGDTLIKIKGESRFMIKGKKANILVDYDCSEGNEYNIVSKRLKKT